MTTCKEVLKSIHRRIPTRYTNFVAGEILAEMKADTTEEFVRAWRATGDNPPDIQAVLSAPLNIVLQDVLWAVGENKLLKSIMASTELVG